MSHRDIPLHDRWSREESRRRLETIRDKVVDQADYIRLLEGEVERLRKEHGELRADFDRLCKERDELLVVVARARAALAWGGGKVSDWESVKARLEEDAERGVPEQPWTGPVLRADIRSALQRDEVREASVKILVKQRDEAETEVERLRAALEGFIYVYEHNGIDDDFAAYEAGKRALRGEGEK